MNYIKKGVSLLIIIIISAIGGFIYGYYYTDRNQSTNNTITLGKITSNTIDYKVDKMEVEDMAATILCYGRAEFDIDVNKNEDGTFTISSTLCERRAYRKAKFEVDEKKNYIIGNITYTYINNRFIPGGEILYYRQFWKPLKFGGGLSMNQNEISFKIGLMIPF